MKRLGAILLVMLAFGIGIAVGAILGFRKGRFQAALQENKIATWNLQFHSTNLEPQLKEYLKARIYCNVFTFYPSTPGYLLQKDWDFGPVNRGALNKIAVFKDPHQIVWDWPSAITNK